MARGPTKEELARAVRAFKRRNNGEEPVIIRASNGEVALLTRKYYNEMVKP